MLIVNEHLTSQVRTSTSRTGNGTFRSTRFLDLIFLDMMTLQPAPQVRYNCRQRNMALVG
eukprot:XP_001698322.1 predicted protein [Chlamydomonas reinhardtii]